MYLLNIIVLVTSVQYSTLVQFASLSRGVHYQSFVCFLMDCSLVAVSLSRV